MRAKIFSFVKIYDTSMVASVRIARFVGQQTGIPIVTDGTVADGKLDLLGFSDGAATIYLALGQGDGTFGTPATMTMSGVTAPLLEVADLACDGNQELVVASGTLIEIHGHTDNEGNADANMKLSEARAFAVKQWMERAAPSSFPEGRVKVVAHGQTEPVASNTTPDGKAKNRRVVIVLGTSGS